MEHLSPQNLATIGEFLKVAKRDIHAEFECKLLAGRIQTKDVVDRILGAIETISVGPPKEEQYLTFSYPDNTRVVVHGMNHIQKVCSNNSFREIPLEVERKERYYDGKSDVLDVSELSSRFTLRRETAIKKDYDGNPSDVKAYPRLINRKSFTTTGGLFQIDISMVKSKDKTGRVVLVRDLLKQVHTYELEIEFIGKSTAMDNQSIITELFQVMTTILKAYHQTGFLLPESDIQRYSNEFKTSVNIFFNIVTMMRKHVRIEKPHNISTGYTVTNKADGERSGLYVASDGKLLKITPKLQITWTGLTSNDNTHAGDFLDGEYIPEKHLFCVFDIYRFRKRDTRNLPLMTTDDDITKNPLNSRLGCVHMFLEDIIKFKVEPSLNPMRIEAKLFLAGDGVAMEEAISQILDTQFEYKTDGLVFTPRSTGVAPQSDRDRNTWKRVYKWKPAEQNSIDFLIRFAPRTQTLGIQKGDLYVSRNARDMYVYPREMMTGEYVPRELPSDFELTSATRIPSVFQPSLPRDPDAYKIIIKLNDKGIPVDDENNKIEDNTIIECAFSTETREWNVLRTRHDKTYQYKVQKEPQYGNDVSVANSNWTSIHFPVTSEMLRKHVTNPIEEAMEDDTYYREDVKRDSRLLSDVYDFHNRIKDTLYSQYIQKGDTLLELAVGKGGDMNRWIKAQPSRIVGMDISLANLASPVDSVSLRYLKKKAEMRVPHVLVVQGNFTHYPLFEQEDKYMPLLLETQTAHTDYLKYFEGLKTFDDVSCQFAMHYACETEESFRNFAKNIKETCKQYFFGTCSDGQSIYSLLMGKQTHIFGEDRRVAGEYTKEYKDKETWSEEFGMPVKVYLESFVKPEIEYLVPFGKVTEIMREMGFELEDTKLFNEIYGNQTRFIFGDMQQTFSFLNRSFVFKRVKELKEPEEKEPEEKEPEEKEPEEKEPEEKEPESEEKEKPKKRKLKKAVEPEQEPVLFFGADESKGEYRGFSNMAEYPMEIDGIKYPSVEHYFQAMKATEFKDEDSLKKIMKTKTGKAVKAVGKKVNNFNQDVWDSKKNEVMEKAVKAKFVQHPELRKKLQETGDKMIGEANPRDLYWGIGTSITQEKAKFPSKWRGLNKLGKILMELRNEFNVST